MQNKKCIVCQQIKPVTDFHNSTSSPDGRRKQCKECRKNESKKYYQGHKEKIIEYVGKFYKTEHGRKVKKGINKRYNGSKKGLENKRHLVAEYNKRNPEKAKAHTAITVAVNRGQLSPASAKTCQHCGQQAEQYHHWSYLPEHWLDVIPLCRQCHTDVHRNRQDTH